MNKYSTSSPTLSLSLYGATLDVNPAVTTRLGYKVVNGLQDGEGQNYDEVPRINPRALEAGVQAVRLKLVQNLRYSYTGLKPRS